MSKRATIKEIAERAGVSVGTVDRILHKRGNVSPRSRAAVDRVMAELAGSGNPFYAVNAKPFVLAVVTPNATVGDYWSSIQEGISRGVQENTYPGVLVEYYHYNQLDVYSCLAAYEAAAERRPDGVVIGPTFVDETVEFCRVLDGLEIPYVFVDSFVDAASPLASFTTDQIACGKVIAHMLSVCTPPGSKIAVFESRRKGAFLSSNSRARREGFLEFLRSVGREEDLIDTCYTQMSPGENRETMRELLSNHPSLKGIAVLNSKGSVIAQALEHFGRTDIVLLSFDLTSQNVKYLHSGTIRALVCQRPVRQGYLAVDTLVRYLAQKVTPATPSHTMPIDLVLRETVDQYREE